MRTIFLFLLLIFMKDASAQQNLSFSRQSSPYTYIYKINAKEATQLYRSDMDKVSETFLHTMVDSFEKEVPLLPAGDYLWVRAVKNRLVFELHAIDDVMYKLLPNNRDLVVILHTTSGKLVADASVSINAKRFLTMQGRRRTGKKNIKRRTAVCTVQQCGSGLPYKKI